MQFKRTGTLMYLLAAPHALIAKFTSPLKISKGQNGVHTADSYSLPSRSKKALWRSKWKAGILVYIKMDVKVVKATKKAFSGFNYTSFYSQRQSKSRTRLKCKMLYLLTSGDDIESIRYLDKF